jgi:phenylpyruvate tautomerase PptA (4-oxalocrotonate tautomerase family)
MPWIHVVTTRKLSAEQEETLQRDLATIFVDLAGKTRPGVYVSIGRPAVFFWGGERRDDAAIFDVQWIGEFGLEVKKEITRRICADLAPEAGLDPDRVRVLFTKKTSEDWGRNRGDFS